MTLASPESMPAGSSKVWTPIPLNTRALSTRASRDIDPLRAEEVARSDRSSSENRRRPRAGASRLAVDAPRLLLPLYLLVPLREATSQDLVDVGGEAEPQVGRIDLDVANVAPGVEAGAPGHDRVAA